MKSLAEDSPNVTDSTSTSIRSPREFTVGQFVFRDPEIYDFYDVVAEAVLETQNKGIPPVKVRVRTWREGSLLRVRLNNIVKARCTLSPWHWCATRFTRQEPDAVYVWIAAIASPAQFLSYYRNYPAHKVMQMMDEPKISVKKLPAQRLGAPRFAIDLDDEA